MSTFKKIKEYITNSQGNHEQVSRWTCTDTIEDSSGNALNTILSGKLNKAGDTMTGDLEFGTTDDSVILNDRGLDIINPRSRSVDYRQIRISDEGGASLDSAYMYRDGLRVLHNDHDILIEYDDIQFSAASNPHTWDGVNTSLRSTLHKVSQETSDYVTKTIPTNTLYTLATIQLAGAGYYVIDSHARWDTNSTGYREIFLALAISNTTPIDSYAVDTRAAISGLDCFQTVFWEGYIAADSHICLMCRQTSGDDLDCVSAGMRYRQLL